MPWLILILSAGLEAVWATALGLSEGLSNPLPSAVFLVATILSMVGLAYAVKTIPVGTAYAVWTGLGAALTASYAVATGAETLTAPKLIFLLLIVAAAAGLKFVGPQEEVEEAEV